MIDVPILTPKLSSYWLRLVTRADFDIARELVEGLRYDLDPTGEIFWEHFPDYELVPLDEAIQVTFQDERSPVLPSPPTRARLARIGRTWRAAA